MIRAAVVRALGRGIVRGNLRVTFADGSAERLGDGTGGEVALRFADAGAEAALVLDPALKLGELYAEGRLLLERGDAYDLVALVKHNQKKLTAVVVPALAAHAVRRGLALLAPRQTPSRAVRNIAHHYNLDEDFYRLFLDEDLQYTCAYFEDPDQTLEQAQLAKKRHLAAKLLLKPGASVLDIGSGWGGLCLYLAEVAQVRATGVTLSEPQYRVAMRRARERDLTDRVDFQLRDYRLVQGRFDRIISVGMFEAIGKKEIENFFVTAARLLDKKGVMVLHSIGRTRPRSVQSPWLEKYIFPGSYIPALSEVLPAVERAGFLVTDLEILRLHYARTLREWRRRFVAKRAEVLAMFDERFFRMWEFYLAASEAGFRIDRMFVFQLQLARHQDAVPLTRGYQASSEIALLGGEARWDDR